MTGHKLGDAYFNRLHNLRNDSAQELRRHGSATIVKETVEILPTGGDQGCESMHNDHRHTPTDGNTGCEAI